MPIFSSHALVMAGGFGKWLKNGIRILTADLFLTQFTPDQLLMFRYISTHFLSDQIRRFYWRVVARQYVTILDEKTPLGTAGSIDLPLRDMSGRLIVTNSDVLRFKLLFFW